MLTADPLTGTCRAIYGHGTPAEQALRGNGRLPGRERVPVRSTTPSGFRCRRNDIVRVLTKLHRARSLKLPTDKAALVGLHSEFRRSSEEARMSILSGLTDAHHEMELSPSARLIRSNWFARHIWAILIIAIAATLYFVL